MADTQPIARSPIHPEPPTAVVAGWEVSTRRASGLLRIVDATPLAKVLIRAPERGAMDDSLRVPFGRAARDGGGTLVVGSGPGEWLLLAATGRADEVVEGVPDTGTEPRTVIDFTHSRALIRLVGDATPAVLATVCAVDLADQVTPNGTALRTSVAKLVTDLVRDDVAGEDGASVRSYLLHCERSSGQYLFDALLDAGGHHGIEIDGFVDPGI